MVLTAPPPPPPPTVSPPTYDAEEHLEPTESNTTRLRAEFHTQQDCLCSKSSQVAGQQTLARYHANRLAAGYFVRQPTLAPPAPTAATTAATAATAATPATPATAREI